MKAPAILAAGLLLTATAQAEIKTEPKAVKERAGASQETIEMMTERQAREVCSTHVDSVQKVAEIRAEGIPLHKMIKSLDDPSEGLIRFVEKIYSLDPSVIYSERARAELMTAVYKNCMKRNSIKSVEEANDMERY